MAHSALKLKNYDEFTFYGGLAPVLFFSAAGVTASFQAARWKPRGVVLTYLFLFLLGFSFNRITDSGFLGEPEMDMLQIIAVGSVLIYLVERSFRPAPWIYLVTAFAIFGGKFVVQALLGGVSVSGVTNLLVPPGVFPIFPWLFLFFMGVFAYRASNGWNALLFLGFVLVGFVLRALDVPLLIRHKWDMTIGYFLVCCTLLFSSFWALRAIHYFRNPRLLSWLVFLGRNSLLFLYVHFPLVLYFKEVRNLRALPAVRAYPFLFWIAILAISAALMWCLLQAAKWRPLAKLFESLSPWILVTMLVFAVGLLVSDDNAVYSLEIGLGVTTAVFFQKLVDILKRGSASASGDKPSDLALASQSGA